MTRLSEAAMPAGGIPREWPAFQRNQRAPPASGRGFDTREQERLEALAAVTAELRRGGGGRDGRAACERLLRHLSGA